MSAGKCFDQNLPQPHTLATETDLQATRTDMACLVRKQEALSVGSALLLMSLRADPNRDQVDVMRQRLQGVEACPHETPIARAELDHQFVASLQNVDHDKFV